MSTIPHARKKDPRKIPPSSRTRHLNSPFFFSFSAGVIGLSSALELQSAGHTVTILAKDFPQPFGLIDAQKQINFTSPWGGAHNRWVPPAPGKETDKRDHELALATFRHMKALCKANPEAGITFMKGIEYLEKPGPEYLALVKASGPGCAKSLGMEGFRVLGKGEVPDERVALGIEYDTWCVNPMVYCSWMLNRFVYRGGEVVKREIREPKEIFEMNDLGSRIDVVVNASGQGFGDDKVFITRGEYNLWREREPHSVRFGSLYICADLKPQDKLALLPIPATPRLHDRTPMAVGPFLYPGILKAELS